MRGVVKGALTFASCFLRAAERLRLGVGLLTAPGLTALRRRATTALRGMVPGTKGRCLCCHAVPTRRAIMVTGNFLGIEGKNWLFLVGANRTIARP